MLEESYRKLLLETLEAEAFFEDVDDESRLDRFNTWKEHNASEPEQGCVTLFDFSVDEKARITQLDSSTELRHYFVSHSAPASSPVAKPPTPMRRLFVLEGLDPRFVDILGSQLRIPPTVFIAQAGDPGTINISDADGYLHDPAEYWNVQVQQLHRLSDGFYENRGSFWKENAAPKRIEGPFGKRAHSWSFTSHLASFWSTKHDGGSWDAVILVDPAWDATVYENIDTKLQESIAGKPEFTVQHDEKSLPTSPHISMQALPSNPAEWTTATTRSLPKTPLMSIRLRLLSLYTCLPHHTTSDPESASLLCRGIIFSLWELTIRVLEWRYVTIWDDEADRSYKQNTYWRGEDFQKIAAQQLVSRRVKKDLLDVCRKLGVVGDKAAAATDDASHKARSWPWLLERVTLLEEQIGDMIMVYGQRSAVQESLVANDQARSVGRLTALATVLVPFTLAAGIFSMSGEFAAGEGRFWVFWAVAIPLAGALLVWVFMVKKSPTQLLMALPVVRMLRMGLGLLRRLFRAGWGMVRSLRGGGREEMSLPVWQSK